MVCYMQSVLTEIRDFADRAHGDQPRKYSTERYINHPVRVMQLCEKHQPRLPVLAAALLHDVLEDTHVTRDELRIYLLSVMNGQDADETLKLVTELTDVYIKKNYPRLNRKKRRAMEAQRLSRASADAQTIKYADILDNSRAISQQDNDFAPVFLRECRFLLDQMPSGDPELRRQAIEVVQHELSQLH